MLLMLFILPGCVNARLRKLESEQVALMATQKEDRTSIRNLEQKIEGMNSRIATLQEKNEEQATRVDVLLERVRRLWDERPSRTEVKSDPAVPVTEPVALPESPFILEAGNLYQSGMKYLRLQQFGRAQLDFEELVALYPKHELAPSALLQSADIFLQQGDARRALDRCARLREGYPEWEGMSRTFLLAGQAAMVLEDWETAQSLFDEVISMASDSKEAEEARRFRERIEKTLLKSGE